MPVQPKVKLTTGRRSMLQNAGAIVLGAKDNERHKLEGAERIKWNRQISQKLCGQIESCKITMIAR